jgi:sedoheptulose-bisphosphatase
MAVFAESLGDLRILDDSGDVTESSDAVKSIFMAVARAVERVSTSNALGSKTSYRAEGTQNAFGDAQLVGDLKAEKCIVEELSKCAAVGVWSSEEMPKDVEFENSGGYSVSFDPLDGSSIIASNFSVGSIFGIFKGRGFVGKSGRDMVGAAYAVYGPRTVLVVAYPTATGNRAVKEFVLVETENKNQANEARLSFVLDSHRALQGSKKLFAPANLRAAGSNEAYRELMEHWMANGYTLRYTGGMVPDIHNILVKGGGAFCNPTSTSAPAKLRLLYECMPFAYVVESANGVAIDGGGRVLDATIDHHDARRPICLGSPQEVDLCRDAMNFV